MSGVHDFTVKTHDGNDQSLEKYKGNVLLIVNTASKCGFVSQFEELQKLYERYKDRGFTVLGFPSDQFMNQEFESIEETLAFCRQNYGVTFPMFAKIRVNGKNADPLYKYLTSQENVSWNGKIKWNFTKFLIDSNGFVVNRFAPATNPVKIEREIVDLLG